MNEKEINVTLEAPKEARQINSVTNAFLKGERGERGEKGDSFKYEDFTPAQLEALKGEKGDSGKDGETISTISFRNSKVDDEFTISSLVLATNEGNMFPFSVMAKNGENGRDGSNGESCSISDITQPTEDSMMIHYINGLTPEVQLINLPRGAKGDTGESGRDGIDGETISKVNLINASSSQGYTNNILELVTNEDNKIQFNVLAKNGEKGETGSQGVGVSEFRFLGAEEEGGYITTNIKAELTDGTYSIFPVVAKNGEKGEAFRYEDFTPEQLEALKGQDGQDGKNVQDAKVYYLVDESKEIVPTSRPSKTKETDWVDVYPTDRTIGRRWKDTSSSVYKFIKDEEDGYYKANNIGVNSSTAESILEIYLAEDISDTIEYQVTSETNYDKFNLKLENSNGVTNLASNISGTGKNATINVELKVGYNKIIATYAKDNSQSATNEKVWLKLPNIEGELTTGYIWACLAVDITDTEEYITSLPLCLENFKGDTGIGIANIGVMGVQEGENNTTETWLKVDYVDNVRIPSYLKVVAYNGEKGEKGDKGDTPDMTKYLDKTNTGTEILKGKIQIGDATTNIANAILHIRKVTSSITGKSVNGACYSVNADGTASLQHKTYNDDGSGAKNSAVLRMSNKGIQFAINTGSSASPSEDMYKELATQEYVNNIVGNIDTELQNIYNGAGV